MENKDKIIEILNDLLEEQQEELNNLKRNLKYIEDDVKYPIFDDEDIDETACKCGKCHNHSDEQELNDILFELDYNNMMNEDKDETLNVYHLDDNTSAIVDELITLNETLEKIYKRM